MYITKLTKRSMKAPIVATPIMLQRVGDDGMTKIGDPIKIFDRATQGKRRRPDSQPTPTDSKHRWPSSRGTQPSP